jgi:hypothetical protein
MSDFNNNTKAQREQYNNAGVVQRFPWMSAMLLAAEITL